MKYALDNCFFDADFSFVWLVLVVFGLRIGLLFVAWFTVARLEVCF
jgi:hypothetical protein